MKTFRVLFSDSLLHMTEPADPLSGKPIDSINHLIASIKEGQEYLGQLLVDNLTSLLDALAASWASGDSEIQRKYASLGLDSLLY